MGTALAGLNRWKLKPSERAAMRAAAQRINHVLTHGMTPEERAQAHAELQALNTPRQPQLALKVRP